MLASASGRLFKSPYFCQDLFPTPSRSDKRVGFRWTLAAALFIITIMQSVPFAPVPPPLPAAAGPKNSAVRAGWICIALGFLTFWIFGLGMVFFSVAMVRSVVAMCKDCVQDGIILLVTSLASCVVCAILLMTVVVGGSLAVVGSVLGEQPLAAAPAFNAKLPPTAVCQPAQTPRFLQSAPLLDTPASNHRRVSPENSNPARRFD